METNINSLYSQIEDKVNLFRVLGKEFDISSNMVLKLWFMRCVAIPEDKQERTIQIMQNIIINQKKQIWN